MTAQPDWRRLSLKEQVARLVVLRGSGHLSDGQRRYPRWELPNAELQRLLRLGVGGVILLGGSAAELRLRTGQLRAWAGHPLLLCADVEEGVGQRFEGASWLVPPMALGLLHRSDPARAVLLATAYGRCTGRQARLLGLNWVLAPVCDVNNNPANPVINVRAWGEDPGSVGELATAFLLGTQAEGVLACAKHFPGHGDTSSDSHLELPVLAHDRERLEALELPPFRQAIAAGVASVMTAHLQLPALDPQRPATLSAAVLDQLLRQDLGFAGLVVTDALVMEAIAGQWGAGEAAVLAFAAGSDLLLMPADADAAIEALLEALQSGRIPMARLEQSLERRERALSSTSLPAPDPGDALSLGDLEGLESNAERALARELATLSLQAQGVAQLPAGPGLNLIRLDSSVANAFLPLMAPALQRPTALGYAACLIDGRSPSPWNNDTSAPLALERLPAGPVLLQLFVRGNPFRGSAGGEEPWPAVVTQLLGAGRLAGLAVYGSPYLWQTLQPLLPADLPAAYSPGQMPLAQAMLLERLGLGAGGIEGGFTD
ncbi:MULTISPECIES: glycoside hydrolase family 3 N-terminal domain-containing protein [unclassified Synechococcus]|uniref:glycoside hydrolase family 3 N-terminal domain-containing protein n=1 Tax=unclassified Synechococcus TaxID=2626047 RepID=UPI0008FF404C|nr:MULTISPECIES: glycoside hydrolase family 3 N-terminal domain-containing protein [unclassified Synechococcus]APD47616.1 glycosyl hydrolase family 3 [Synechococcus sp. SynAce01]MCT0245448.1 glycosyl hydrolase family 3 [Synechococcus sp. CS-601]TWB90367.1 beta-glucosidase [Synechococcus sp. Ace-Pa]